MSPLQYLHTRFILWKRESDYRLEHNGQVCYLRALLNDKFDPIDRRITITETVENVGFITLHKRKEDAEVLVPRRGSGRILILNRRGYGGVSGCDFWVSVPYALMGKIDETRLAAVVSTYKLASKRWTINYN